MKNRSRFDVSPKLDIFLWLFSAVHDISRSLVFLTPLKFPPGGVKNIYRFSRQFMKFPGLLKKFFFSGQFMTFPGLLIFLTP